MAAFWGESSSMVFVRIVAALFVALVCSSAAAAAPLSAYGKLPTVEQVVLSPSGKRLAVVVTDGERRTVTVKDLESSRILMVAEGGDQKVRDIMFAGEDHVLVVASVTSIATGVSAGRREWLMAHDMDLKAGKVRRLMSDAAESMNTIHGSPMVRLVEGKPQVFIEGIYFGNGRGRLSVYRINLDRAQSQLVEQGDEDTIDWLLGPDGAPIAQEIYDQQHGRWSLKLKAKVGWRETEAIEAKLEAPYLMGLGRDGSSLLVGRDGKWSEVGAADGVWGEGVPVTDNQSPIFDPVTGRWIGHYALVGDEDRYVFFDPRDARVWKAVQAAFPEDRVEPVSWSDDRQKIIVLCDSPTMGPAYALVDLASKKATWLGAQFTELKEADISPKQAIRYKAADGLELTGYLTLPRGRAAKNLPLVVFPHGGPAARDTPGFDWWAQGMASRGYAVLQVNFRGSDGLGGDLLKAGYGQWGRKMQTDLSDGVRHLAAQGVIDAKRVCIVGASYGGYAALAGATHDRGVYRCAASVAGPSDLRRMVDWSGDRNGIRSRRYWMRFMGAKDLRDPVLGEISPAAFVDKVEIPILLIHGKDDTVVPPVQSQIMADALKRAGKPYELVIQPGADHWLSRGDTRLQTLEATVAFLEKHNPPN
ncbi:alpha/beta hydrolase family protein [Phenylobacterium sp. VNQ135]|uniref:alpha/beta hydrolase family protein n=1 Tax=Phenylobacterium sp. VNQ135 TaxID=3400922 RepID=UPI003C0F8F17